MKTLNNKVTKEANELIKDEDIKSGEFKKIRFWNIYLIITFVLFGLSIITAIISPEERFDNIFYLTFWLLIFFGSVGLLLSFTIAMIYYSFNEKKYIWTILIILFGIIFPLIFYFSYLRKKWKGEIK